MTEIKEEIAVKAFKQIELFNKDMKILAMNIYQLEELLYFSEKENEYMIDWFLVLDEVTEVVKDEMMK